MSTKRSAALGFYTPVKGSPMDSLFQLGVTRYATPESGSGSGSGNGNGSSNGGNAATATSNGGASFNGNGNGNGSIVGIGEGLIKGERESNAAEEEEADYHLSAGVVYSEGTQKTDLLY